MYRDWPFFRALVENLEMTLAKSSFEIAEGYLSLVPPEFEPDRFWQVLADEHARTVEAVLAIVEADALLDRHPVVQRSIRLRNPYVDPINAIQVELLAAWRGGDERALAAPAPLDRRHRRGAPQHRLTRGLVRDRDVDRRATGLADDAPRRHGHAVPPVRDGRPAASPVESLVRGSRNSPVVGRSCRSP